MKLSKQRASTDVPKFFFSQHMVNEWNQEASRQVLAELWALKARLNQSINGQDKYQAIVSDWHQAPAGISLIDMAVPGHVMSGR